jgi:hypothetical protein
VNEPQLKINRPVGLPEGKIVQSPNYHYEKRTSLKRPRVIAQQLKQFRVDIKREFGESVSAQESIETIKPKKNGFPYVMMGMAIFVDFSDFLQIGVISYIAVLAINVVFFIILLVWLIGQGRWWKKRAIKFLIRLGGVFIAQLIPIIGLIPWTVLFVYLKHNEDKKIVKVFNKILEQVRDLDQDAALNYASQISHHTRK